MPIYIGKRRRPKVRFPSTSSSSNAGVVGHVSAAAVNRNRSATDQAEIAQTIMNIPDLFTHPPPIQDPIPTGTSELQNETVGRCLPFLKGVEGSQKGPFNEHGVQALQRDPHVEFLCDALEDYPAGFVILDASRPWIMLWALSGLSLLGEDLSRYRERYAASGGMWLIMSDC